MQNHIDMKKLTPYEMINAVLVEKSSMKQDIYYNTLEIFKEFKKEIKKIVDQLNEDASKKDRRLIIEFAERGEFEVELKFAGDVLIFYMHTNVFKFNAEHDISKTKYAKEDIRRRYCGIISVYNFLADSFKYNRANDLGYMIARVFVNNENHYAMEGKEQLGQLHLDYEKAVIDQAAIKAIVESCMLYTLDFDLLTPPFEAVQEVSVHQIKEATNHAMLKTGKRMGFTFSSDVDNIE